MEEITISQSHIKGYHIFKITPHKEIKLQVLKEVNNKKDPNAMPVKMPGLEEIPVNLHDNITRPRKKLNEKNQTVKEIAGKDVGQVSANLCGVFRDLQKSGKATNKYPLVYHFCFFFHFENEVNED